MTDMTDILQKWQDELDTMLWKNKDIFNQYPWFYYETRIQISETNTDSIILQQCLNLTKRDDKFSMFDAESQLRIWVDQHDNEKRKSALNALKGLTIEDETYSRNDKEDLRHVWNEMLERVFNYKLLVELYAPDPLWWIK